MKDSSAAIILIELGASASASSGGAFDASLRGVLSVVAALAIAAAQQPTFRAGVTLVSTDVIPRDRERPLRRRPDAARTSPCSRTASRRRSRPSRSSTAAAPTTCCAGRAARPRPKASCCRPPKPRADDTAGRVLLIFIDDLHFEPEITPHVRKVMQTIGDTLIHDGDLVAVVSSGPSYHRDRPDLRQEARHGGGREDSRLRPDPGRDLQDARDVAGARRHPRRARRWRSTPRTTSSASSSRSTTSARR